MINFLKGLLSHWIALLGLIPALYDLINAYLKFDFQFPKFIIYLFAGGAFLYATYKTYLEEYKKRVELEEKLLGPTNYKIIAILTPIDFGIEQLIDGIKTKREEAIKILEQIRYPEKLSKNNSAKFKISVSSSALNMHEYREKSDEQYIAELEKYKIELQNYINNADKEIENIRIKTNKLSKSFHFIKFVIENIGITSDLDIDIDIDCESKCIVFNEEKYASNGLDVTNDLPVFPKKPEKSYLVGSHITMVSPASNRIGLSKNFNRKYFRNILKIDNGQCKIRIRDLNVGDQIDLFNQKLIIKCDEEDIRFNVQIKSKNSTRILTPNVEVKYSKDTMFLNNKEVEE